MILIVGDQPSAQTNPHVPFQGAACESRLKNWIKALGFEAKIINRISPYFGLSVTLATQRGVPIVALGNEASEALTALNTAHFKLPHPSGLNRQINDPEFISNKLFECREWLKERL